MTNILILPLMLLSVSFGCLAHASELPNPYSLRSEELHSGNILAPIVELQAREEDYLVSPLKRQFLDTLGILLSNVGNYTEALRCFDRMKSPPKWWQKVDFGNVRPVQALKVIRKIADSNRAIFINEAHHVPQHRAFSILVLKELYKKGFRYFAAETLSDFDKELSSRGYPIMFVTGYYTNEPIYGDLIRQALRLGFHVIPYESSSRCQPRKDDINYCQNVRERTQAENLYARIFKNDPNAKAIVHAGYGHIDERGGGGWNPMAKYFKEISGIDPFTIDQEVMTEHSSEAYENPYYRNAVDEIKISEPTIFQLKDGSFWVEPYRQSAYDAQVFHPRSRYQKGRPDWLLMQGARQLYPLTQNICNSKFPCVVQAFFENEDDSAVPADQVMITKDMEPTALVLPQGYFRIRVVAQNGKIISLSAIQVK